MMRSMVQIGNIELDLPCFQAGLAGYSDSAMRRIARRYGAPYCISEAMLDRFLNNGGKGVDAAELPDDDHPIAGQLMGSEPAEMASAAKILVELGYDVIDVNLACPVKKVRRKHRGGHLLQAPDKAIDILKAVIDAVGADRPCTVKLRRATDDEAASEARFHQVLEAIINLGYAGTVVHGRTVEQKYIGPSRWPALRKIVRQYEDAMADGFVLGGSGDIWEAADVPRMIDETGVALVSVARGCIGNPWIFRQVRDLLAGDPDAARRPPTIHQQRDVLLEHFQLSMEIYGEKRSSRMMRKFGIRFSRHHPAAEQVRKRFIAVTSIEDWRAVLDEHYAENGPGVFALPKEATPTGCDTADCPAGAMG